MYRKALVDRDLKRKHKFEGYIFLLGLQLSFGGKSVELPVDDILIGTRSFSNFLLMIKVILCSMVFFAPNVSFQVAWQWLCLGLGLAAWKAPLEAKNTIEHKITLIY